MSVLEKTYIESLHPRDPHTGQWVGKTNWLGSPVHLSGLHRRGEDPAPAMTLVTTGQPDMVDDKKHSWGSYSLPALGRLLVPGMYDSALDTQKAGVPFAADNGGFFGVDETKYKKMIEKLHSEHARPKWITVPDVLVHRPKPGEDPHRWRSALARAGLPDDFPEKVVGDGDATIQRYEQWKQYLDHQGMPNAFVVQDGMDRDQNWEWLKKHIDGMDAVFIGGSDDFKLGPGAVRIAQLAHKHGKLVHLGRVNTRQRIAYARDVMHADTFDGSSLARFKHTLLPGMTGAANSVDPPPTKIGREWIEAAREALRTGSPWPRPPGIHKPKWPRGTYPADRRKPIREKAVSAVYFEEISDALYRVGLSDYVHLHFEPGTPGFSVDLTDERQPEWLAEMLDLPAPEIKGDTASWPGIEVRPGNEDEFEDSTKAYNPKQPRDPGGEGGGQWVGMISNHLVTGADKDGVANAMQVIGQVHSMPAGADPIGVYPHFRDPRAHNKSTLGLFAEKDEYGEPMEPPEIIINTDKGGTRGQYAETMAHEFGHYMDWAINRQQTNKPGAVSYSGFASDNASLVAKEQVRDDAALPTPPNELVPVMRAIYESDGYQMVADPLSFQPDDTREYLKRPREAFARAYAQWIAQKRPRSFEDHYPPGMGGWTDDDFEPISDALDKAFSDLGLLKESPRGSGGAGKAAGRGGPGPGRFGEGGGLVGLAGDVGDAGAVDGDGRVGEAPRGRSGGDLPLDKSVAVVEMREIDGRQMAVVRMVDFKARWDPHEHPRDNHGRFAETPGGGALTAWERLKEAVGRPINVGSDVNRAAKLLGEGHAVRLDQPSRASTLLDRLSKIAHDAEKKGDKAPNYDLCKVSVKGTNLFCAKSKGIPRLKMPQLKGKPLPGSKADKFERDDRGEVDLGPEFLRYLEDRGIEVNTGKILASRLKATQNELIGTKVAGMMQAKRKGTKFEGSIWVSSDNYVVDGHHRWATDVALDAEDNKLGDIAIDVKKADIPIPVVLAYAKQFAREYGIPQVGVNDKADVGKVELQRSVPKRRLQNTVDKYLRRVEKNAGLPEGQGTGFERIQVYLSWLHQKRKRFFGEGYEGGPDPGRTELLKRLAELQGVPDDKVVSPPKGLAKLLNYFGEHEAELYDTANELTHIVGVPGIGAHSIDPERQVAVVQLRMIEGRRLAVVQVMAFKDFDPHQPRDPHTGEWVKVPGTEFLKSPLFLDPYHTTPEHRASPHFKPLPKPDPESAPSEQPPLLLAPQIASQALAIPDGGRKRFPEGTLVRCTGTGARRNYRIDGCDGTFWRIPPEDVGKLVEFEETTARANRYGDVVAGNQMVPLPGVDVHLGPPGDPVEDRIGGLLHGGITTLPRGTTVHRRVGTAAEGHDTFELESPTGATAALPSTDKQAIIDQAREFEKQGEGRLGGADGGPGDFTPTKKARDRNGPLQPLNPDKYPATRIALHAESERVLGYTRFRTGQRVGGRPKVALVHTKGGFGTPEYTDTDGKRTRYRVDGTDTVLEKDGVEVARDPIVGVDSKSAKQLADFYALNDKILREVQVAGVDPGSSGTEKQTMADRYGAPIIWSEHFDQAVEIGKGNMDNPGGRAVFGASPGDIEHPEPYFYVGPWQKQEKSKLWNADGFNGAILPYSEVLASPDQEKTIRDFYSKRMKALGTEKPDTEFLAAPAPNPKLAADFDAVLAEYRAEAKRRNPRLSTRTMRVVPIERMFDRGYTLEDLRAAHRDGSGYIISGRDRKPAQFGMRERAEFLAAPANDIRIVTQASTEDLQAIIDNPQARPSLRAAARRELADRRKALKKFDPHQPRDPGGIGGGQWVKVPGVDAAVKQYSQGWSSTINGLLRGGPDLSAQPWDAFKVSAEQANEATRLIPGMDKAIAHGGKTPREVYRGINLTNAPGLEKKLHKGQTFTDGGYLSTSANEQVAFNFSFSMLNQGITLVIKVPGGTKSLLIADQDNEAEHVLPRGGTFKVLSDPHVISYFGGKHRVVEVEWSPPHAK